MVNSMHFKPLWDLQRHHPDEHEDDLQWAVLSDADMIVIRVVLQAFVKLSLDDNDNMTKVRVCAQGILDKIVPLIDRELLALVYGAIHTICIESLVPPSKDTSGVSQ